MFPMKDTNPPALIAPTIPNVEATPHTPVSHAYVFVAMPELRSLGLTLSSRNG